MPSPIRVQVETCRVPAGAQDDAAWLARAGLGDAHPSFQGADVRPGVRLGIDVGSVRIGVARSDPGGVLASPLGTVRRGGGDLAELARLAAENDVMEIIVGLAVGLRGGEGKAGAAGRDFAVRLAGRLAPLPVRLVDERFTTVLAHAALQRSGQDARARRQAVDKAAAAVLLQGALDAERSTGEPAGQLVAAGDRIP